MCVYCAPLKKVIIPQCHLARMVSNREGVGGRVDPPPPRWSRYVRPMGRQIFSDRVRGFGVKVRDLWARVRGFGSFYLAASPRER